MAADYVEPNEVMPDGEDYEANKKAAAEMRREYEQWRKSARDERAPFAAIFGGFLGFLGMIDGLRSTDVKLYVYLALRANRQGELWYKVDRMVADLRMGKRTVQRSLHRLEYEYKLIVRTQFSARGVARTFLRPYPLHARLEPAAPEEDEGE